MTRQGSSGPHDDATSGGGAALGTVLAPAREIVWHVAAVVIVFWLPVYWRMGRNVLDGSADVLAQAALAAFGYVLAALFVSVWRYQRTAIRILLAAAAVAAAFAAVAALPLVNPDLALSRSLLAASALVSLSSLGSLALVPSVPLPALALLCIGAASVGLLNRPAATAHERRVESQFYSLRIRSHRHAALAERLDIEGGGLTRADDHLLLVTGAGRFARLRSLSGQDLEIHLLDVPSPANVEEFRADVPPGVLVQWFRVMDIAANLGADAFTVNVSHHFWNRRERCYVLRVSTAVASLDLLTWGPWRPLFDTQPCLPIKTADRSLPFYGSESGGRLVNTDDGLLLSVGDHAFDGFNARGTTLAQDPASHYGKTVRITADGTATVFTSGHRNPQGLLRDRAGRFWETEHGPRGGDELNLLVANSNYGWPWRTHGTEYAMRSWPPLRPADSAFVEPTLAFVPSRGISNLIDPTGKQFEKWHGDLLVGTLKSRQLMRVRLDGDRPVYVEDIDMGFELRDLAQAADGTLLAWTDEGVLLSIEPDEADAAGDTLVSACTGCHTLNQGQFGALGPNLHGIIDRSVASAPGFNYSAAMKSVGGHWTVDRLDAFLADPKAFAPGTTMLMAVHDADKRRLIIDFLRTVDIRR